LDAQLSQRAQDMGWRVPASLAELCKVRDGFGPQHSGILASRFMVDMGLMMDPIATEQKVIPEG